MVRHKERRVAHQPDQVVNCLRFGERLVPAFVRDHPHPCHLCALYKPVQGPEEVTGPWGDCPVADVRGEEAKSGHQDEVGNEVVRGRGQISLKAVPRDRLLYVGELE